MQQNLSKFTIYTIASKDKLVTASNNKGATKFTEAHPWTTGYDLWSKADHVGEAMPVVFADAGECGPLL